MSPDTIFRTHWHHISAREAAHVLNSDPKNGLGEQAVQRRRELFGLNKLPEEPPAPRIVIFLKQFKSPLMFILLLAGFVTLFFQEYTDSVVIFGTVLVNTIIGYTQEARAGNALAKLKQVLHAQATVIRNGQEMQIPQPHIVPGDLIKLNPGDKVPADGRLLTHWNLHTQEASLTGEWLAASKHPAVLPLSTALADRDNMVYMGTVVQEGSGTALVCATGGRTELGKISMLLGRVKEQQTPYQKKLTRFSWFIGLFITLLALVIFAQGILTGTSVLEMFELAVAIAVSAIPEGLPIAMTIVLALGMQRILSAKGLVRNLPAAETLGSTTVIATDKTLTLTEGTMEVQEVVPLRVADREQTLTAAALANEAFVENPHEALEKQIVRGRPTDRALVRAGMEAGLSKAKLEEALPLILRIPFDSGTKYIASFHKTPEEIKLFVAGAPEAVLALSNLSADEAREAAEQLSELTQQGLRVVSTATKNVPRGRTRLKDEISQLRFAGFIALKDPVRKGVGAAVQAAKGAGIKTVIVTGDHALTARAVAKELGLPAEQDNVLEGRHLDALGDRELDKLLPRISVFARVEPAHKLRIIEAWQGQGAVIAMTGDGVNDAPALKRADIGLALGSGTDVAREVADLVLLDDKFSIISAAIKEGRVMLDNIRKVITFMLSGAFTETILIGSTLLIGAPFLPITALQILWINLVEGTLPSIALSTEKAEKDVMRRRPPKPNTSLLTPEMRALIFVIGIITDFILLLLFYWLLGTGSYEQTHVQSIVFVGLGIGSLLYVFSCRSLRKNIWEYNPLSNLWLVGSVLASFALLFAVLYVPVLQRLFETHPLNAFDWALLAGLGILNVLAIEFGKWIFIRRDRKKALSTEL